MPHRVPLLVRLATREDAAALVTLWRDSIDDADTGPLRAQTGTGPWHEPSPEEAAAAIAEHSAHTDKRLWVAVIDDEVVGVLAALWRTVTPLHIARMVIVTDLEVAPRWRRRSVATTLLGAATAWAEELDSEVVVTFAGHRQRDSARFLARLGFAQTITARAVQTSVLRARLTARSAQTRTTQVRGTTSRGTMRKIAVRRALRRRRPDAEGAADLPALPVATDRGDAEPMDPRTV